MSFRELFVLSCFLFCISCREPKTAVSCSGVNQSGTVRNTQTGEEKKHRGSKRQKKSKGQDGFVAKDKTVKRSAKKAEKGKKKDVETKPEKKFHLFERNQAAKKDAASQDKKVFRTDEKKRRKEAREKSRHPQNGNPPKGQI